MDFLDKRDFVNDVSNDLRFNYPVPPLQTLGSRGTEKYPICCL